MEAVAVNPDFWRGRRVFLTGHTGFKGAWLTLWLQKVGADVTALSLAPPTQPNLFTEANVVQGINSLHGDSCTTTLRHTVEWYRAWIRHEDMRTTSLAQIDNYQEA